MARNEIESEFRISKMGAAGHFKKKIKKLKVLYWFEMARNSIESEFRTSTMVDGCHFVKNFQKN